MCCPPPPPCVVVVVGNIAWLRALKSACTASYSKLSSAFSICSEPTSPSGTGTPQSAAARVSSMSARTAATHTFRSASARPRRRAGDAAQTWAKMVAPPVIATLPAVLPPLLFVLGFVLFALLCSSTSSFSSWRLFLAPLSSLSSLSSPPSSSSSSGYRGKRRAVPSATCAAKSDTDTASCSEVSDSWSAPCACMSTPPREPHEPRELCSVACTVPALTAGA